MEIKELKERIIEEFGCHPLLGELFTKLDQQVEGFNLCMKVAVDKIGFIERTTPYDCSSEREDLQRARDLCPRLQP